jgi:hypothetical protein
MQDKIINKRSYEAKLNIIFQVLTVVKMVLITLFIQIFSYKNQNELFLFSVPALNWGREKKSPWQI